MNVDRELVENLFQNAEKNGYAIPHFNHSDFWDMSAIVEEAQQSETPIFLACLPKVIETIGIDKLGAIAKIVMEESNVPVIYHLDHCHSVELCLEAVNYGYKSVMIDAADLPLEENIAAVKKVVEYAHAKGVHVEAEIGKIKSAGDEGYTPEETLAGVEEAKRLVEETNVDALAVSIGSEHGFYQHEPKLNYDLLNILHSNIKVPLVLHGGSGIPEEKVRRAINGGIRKVNVGTHVRYTYIKSVGEAIEKMGAMTHTADIMAYAKKNVKEVVKEWMRICTNK